MKILFDTNVILDVLLHRDPFAEEAITLLGYVETGVIEGWMGATTVTTIHYLVTKSLNKEKAQGHIQSLMKLFHIAAVNRPVLMDAIDSQFADYEDAVLYQSAYHASLKGIVTRDTSDFKRSEIAIYSPRELIGALDNLHSE